MRNQLLVFFLIFAGLLLASIPRAGRANLPPELLEQIETEGEFRVIIQLEMPDTLRPFSQLSPVDRQQRQQQIQTAQETVSQQLSATGSTVEGRSRRVPALVARVNRQGLEQLAQSTAVRSIHREQILTPLTSQPISPMLAESAPTIEADTMHSRGFTGAGRGVAILDTGIDDHPAFGGRSRIVAEACFSDGDCPNNSDTMVGPGAAAALMVGGTPDSHGTHAASIAAGSAVPSLNIQQGVAPEADIIGINIFHDAAGEANAREWDLYYAIEWLTELAEDSPVVSANLSLGAGSYDDHCDNVGSFGIGKEYFDDLIAAGVIPIAASGNAGQTDRVAFPACLSNTVAVGATSTSGGSEQIASFSDLHPDLADLVAPGHNIWAAKPGNDAGEQSGTSFAAPHVAGGIGLLREALAWENPSDSELINALKETGEPIQDQRFQGQGSYKSIRLNASYEMLAAMGDTYLLTVDIEGDGEVRVDGASYTEPLVLFEGSTVTLEAIPEKLNYFDGWTGDLTGSDSTVQLFIDADKQLTARFEAHDTQLLTINQTGQGEVAVDGELYTAPRPVIANETVELSAVAEEFWYFVDWSGDHSSSDSTTSLLIDTDKTVEASFAPHDTYSLTLDINGNGTVLVDGDSYTTTRTVIAGETVELTAVADQFWLFDSWEGDLSGSTESEQLLVEQDKQVTVNFLQDQYNLTIVIEGEGEVLVEGDTYVGPIQLLAGETVVLEAIPANYYEFYGWEGGTSGSSQITGLFMDDDKLVTAVFVPEQFAGGEGTALEPYEISNWYHLDSVRHHMQAYFRVIDHLDSNSFGYTELAGPDANGNTGWQPLGSSSNAFGGSFDGQNYQLSGLFINRPAEEDIGLFGASVGTIENLHLKDLTISGGSNSGGVAGINQGSILWSSSSGTVSGTNAVGGLVGSNSLSDTLANSYSRAAVEGEENVGGLVGNNFLGNISKSYSAGPVTGIDNTGGLAGNNLWGNIQDSFWDTETSNQSSSAGGEGLTTEGMQNIDNYLAAGWDIAETSTITNDGYPFHPSGSASWKISENSIDLTVNIIGSGNVYIDGETYTTPTELPIEETVDFEAVPAPGWRFDGWSDDLSGTEPVTSLFTGVDDKSITASFTQLDTSFLTIDLQGEGTVLVDGDSYTAAVLLARGTTVTVEAVPQHLWYFTGWTGDYTVADTSFQLLVDDPVDLTANFAAHDTHLLTVQINGGGTVAVNGADYQQPLAVQAGETATLTAWPEYYWFFEVWTGAASGTDTEIELLIDSDMLVAANFGQFDTYLLEIDITGNGTVLVNQQPYSSAQPVIAGDSFSLEAVPDSYWSFDGWGGASTQTDSSIELVADDDIFLSASFTRDTEIFSASISGEGELLVNGTSYTTPLIIEAGETVLLEAVAEKHWYFSGWGGDLTGSDSSEILLIDEHKQVELNFQRIPRLIVINTVGPGVVLVDGDSYSGPFIAESGDTLELKAQPESFCYRLDSWTGGLTGETAVKEHYLEADLFATASFIPNFAGGTGTAADPFEIATWTELNSLRCFPDSSFLLIENLDPQTAGYQEFADEAAHGGKGWEPLGTVSQPFNGGFDGEDRLIEGLQINRPDSDHIGLFGQAGDSSQIKRLNLINTTVQGRDYVAALAGSNRGAIYRLAVDSGNIRGQNKVGGLIGEQQGETISISYSDLPVEGTNNSGGLVGSNYQGTIINSYAMGAVTGQAQTGGLIGENISGLVINSYAVGSIPTNLNSGGLIGESKSSAAGPPQIISSFWDLERSGITISSGGQGLYTGQLKNIYTLQNAGWAIEPTGQDQNRGYPYLSGDSPPWIVPVDHVELQLETIGEGQIKFGGEPAGETISLVRGETIPLQAVADDYWHFVEWSNGINGESATKSFYPEQNSTISARFERDTHLVELNRIGPGTVLLNGDTVNSPRVFYGGESVTITALPEKFYQLQEWQGDLQGDTAEQQLLIDSDKSITALFSRDSYSLTIDLVGQGGVTVNGEPYQGPVEVTAGETVQLEAHPDTHWQFSEWDNSINSSALSFDLFADTDKFITARFERDTILLSIDQQGEGTVLVAGETYQQPGISLYSGETVELVAISDDFWSFDRWDNLTHSSGETALLYAEQDREIKLFFTQDTRVLQLHIEGNGTVLVDSENYTTTLDVPAGDTIDLTAVAEANWRFFSWQGDLTGNRPQQGLFVDDDKIVTASFKFAPLNLTITTRGEGAVLVEGETYISTVSLIPGETVTLTVNPEFGWHFKKWTGELDSFDSQLQIAADTDLSLTANFQRDTHILTVTAVGEGEILINGIKYEQPFVLPAGETVQLEAVPDEFSRFSSWSGALSGTEPVQPLAIYRDRTVGALFVKKSYTLEAELLGEGELLIDSDTYVSPLSLTAGETIQLTALPAEYWRFDSWDKDLSGETPQLELLVDRDFQLELNFLRKLHELKLQVEGNGLVTINGQLYQEPLILTAGETVALQATAGPGAYFAGWRGDLLFDQPVKNLLIDTDKLITAVFWNDYYSLEIEIIGEGDIFVEGQPYVGPIDLASGDTIVLEASPEQFYLFSAWRGDIDSRDLTTEVFIDSDKKITADFNRDSYLLTVDITGSGKIQVDDSYYTTPRPIFAGETLTLTAHPEDFWKFEGWEGALTSSDTTIQIFVESDLELTGVFQRRSYLLEITVDGRGDIIVDGVKYDNPLAVTAGETVILSAIDQRYWPFIQWTGDLSGTDTTTVLFIDGDKQIQANFDRGGPGLSQLRVGPNPFRPDDGRSATGEAGVRFEFNSFEDGPYEIEIYTITGRRVYRTTTHTDPFVWDGRTPGGRAVSSGYYLYNVREKSSGQNRTGRLAIIWERDPYDD